MASLRKSFLASRKTGLLVGRLVANVRTWDTPAEFIFNFARKTAGQQGAKS
jgi:hypothetical protein